MKIKLICLTLICVIFCATLAGCRTTPATATPTVPPQTGTTPDATGEQTSSPKTDAASENEVTVTLNGNDVVINGDGAEFDNGKIVITKSGRYSFSGTLSDGQIFVNATKSDRVYLILNNANITCSKSSAIYVACADKTTVIVNEGTTNKLADGKSYEFATADSEPNACIYSADDMTIKGTGTLEVTGNYKNGISSKNDITIKELTLTVNAYNTAIRGKDSVEIESGKIKLDAGNDGIKSTNEEEAGRGYVLITGGEVTIVAGDDCIQGVTDVTISGGVVYATAGGKEINSAGTTNVSEGCLK